MLLITGITGHTGTYFLQELIENKYKGRLRCVVRETSNIDLLVNSGLDIELVYGDLNEQEFLNLILDGVEQVFHIYNIHHSPSLVKLSIEKDIKRLVLVHTTGIYSNFKQASQRYKEIENEINQIVARSKSQINITILRPSMIYGDLCDSNISKFIKIVDKLPLIPLVDDGKSLIQPVNARDLGKAYYKVLMNEEITCNKSYDLTGDKPITMKEMYSKISAELGKKRIFLSIPIKFGVIIATLVRVATFRKIDYVERVQRMGENRSYSHEEAKVDWNYEPMSFDEGLRIEVSQYKTEVKR